MKTQHRMLPALCGLLMIVALGGTVRAQAERSIVTVVRNGDIAGLRAIVQKGADVNRPAGDSTTALHWAAYRGDDAATALLLGARANPNATTDIGITPLWLATTNGHGAVVKRLLNAGANPNLSPATGGTALMRAARAGDVEVARLLLAHGADVNARESAQQQTALMWAASRRQGPMVKLLIEAGADVRATAKKWREIVQLCCWANTSDPSDITEIDRGGFTALLFAARQGDVDSARSLLAGGANIEETSAEGVAPLALAAFSNHAPLVRFLLEQGANPNAGGGGFTALHAAVLRGNHDAVKALLAHKADPNLQVTRPTAFTRGTNDYQFHKHWVGATPFWLAAAFYERDLMRVLASSGADPRRPTKAGWSPLLAAAAVLKRQTRYEAMGLELVSAEQEANALATITMLVRDFNADVNAPDDRGDTPVHRAADRRLTKIVQFLGENGADVNVKNKKGRTPVAVVEACTRCELPGVFELDHEMHTAGLRRPETLAILRKLGARD